MVKKNQMNLLIGVGIGVIGTLVVLQATGRLFILNTVRAPSGTASYGYPVQPSPPRTFYAPGGTGHGYTTAVINA